MKYFYNTAKIPLSNINSAVISVQISNCTHVCARARAHTHTHTHTTVCLNQDTNKAHILQLVKVNMSFRTLKL